MSPYSLYLHIPFCRHRCGYCDFNTYAGLGDLIEDYVQALVKEIEMVGEAAGRKLPVHTVFFGGGTPSLLSAGAIEAILQAVESAFELLPGVEITIEANPGTVDESYLADVKRIGVNRLSLGVQSANPQELRILEREHGYAEAIEAVRDARKAEFDNISIDLIYGLPGQTLAAWESNLALALELAPEHISLYSLTVEHGTPLENLVDRGLLQPPDPDLGADMYEATMDVLNDRGFVHYEISNWAKKGADGNLLAAHHNRQYWLNQPYLGLGAGAHGYAGNVRTMNVLAPQAYIKRCMNGDIRQFPRSAATVNVREIDAATEMQETMMMGLRLLDRGVSRGRFEARFQRSMEEVFEEEIGELIQLGLLEWGGQEGGDLRLTKRGTLLGNQVFLRFI